MGGGSSKSRQGSAQKWAKPFAKAAAAETQSVYNDNRQGLQDLTGQVQGLVPGLIDKYNAGDPSLNAAQGYVTSTLDPSYLSGSNPYLENIINTTNANVRDQVGAAYGSRGSYGGTAWESALAKGLAGNEAGLRYGDYNNRMQAQQSAAGMAPQQAAAGYLGIQPTLAAATAGAQIPYTGISALDSNLASLFQGGKTKTTEGIGSTLSGIGSMMSGGAALGKLSDRRLKENIERVGELPDGLGVYHWNYIWDAPEVRHEGVMADEVAELRPWALGPLVDGFATVNYGAL